MLASTSGSLWGREIGAARSPLPSERPRYSKPIQFSRARAATWASNYRAYFSARPSCVTNNSSVETNGSVPRAAASGPTLLTAKDGCLCVSRAQDTQGDRGWTQWPQGTTLAVRAGQWRYPALITARRGGRLRGPRSRLNNLWVQIQTKRFQLAATLTRLVVSGARTWSSTNRRIAEDRFPLLRFLSISATTFDSVACWAFAIFLRSCQNASSRLTLVLCPAIATERLMTEDFTIVSPMVCGFRKPP